MQRSKLWKKYVPYTKKDPSSGWVNAYETTMGRNGFHFHSHSFVCCPRITKRIKEVEQELRDKWLKITGDSYGFKLQLLKIDNSATNSVQKCIREVFKYSLKVGDTKCLDQHADMLGKYLIETKGRNMVNAKGFFRGMQLFSKDSKYDKAPEEKEAPADCEKEDSKRFLVGKTVDLNFNHKTHKIYSKKYKKKVLESVYLRDVRIGDKSDLDNIERGFAVPAFFDVTGGRTTFEIYMKQVHTIQDYMDNIAFWIESAENHYVPQSMWFMLERTSKAISKTEEPEKEATIDDIPNEQNENMKNEQLSLFDEGEQASDDNSGFLEHW